MAYPQPYPQAYQPPPSRPVGVAILAILMILAGALLTLLALLLVFGSSLILVGGVPLAGLALAGSFIFLLLSLLVLAAGLGLWHLRPWAWWLSVIVLVLIVVNEFWGTTLAHLRSLSAVSLLIIGFPVLLLIYLIAVRHHFRKAAPVAYAPPR